MSAADWHDFTLAAPDEATAKACARAIRAASGGVLAIIDDAGAWVPSGPRHAWDPVGVVVDEPAAYAPAPDDPGHLIETRAATYLPGWRGMLRVRTARAAEVHAMLESVGAQYGVTWPAEVRREWTS
ncbi:hypothetical protein [Rhodospira trueperi]|uniref:Uncharacterized protein n=1 Tax=Rhodospira trueperi TaxID=69960 RepID=A0A1G7D2A4_9PROT|nr:hypothetical protein [Rhodospira trueperi]SDE45659.1 hypothetical protein SAMN05421720_1072 [Rhodospira trueperi]